MRRQPTLQYRTLHTEPYKLTGRCPCQILRFWPASLEWLELGPVVPQQFVSQLCILLFVATCVGTTQDTAICFSRLGEGSEDHRMYRRNCLTFRCLRRTTVCTVSVGAFQRLFWLLVWIIEIPDLDGMAPCPVSGCASIVPPCSDRRPYGRYWWLMKLDFVVMLSKLC
jgi:hypothetical protein